MMMDDDEYDDEVEEIEGLGLWEESEEEGEEDFDDPKPMQALVGHQDITKHLEYLKTQNRLPHALLFTGPRGIGKAKVAEACARMLLAGKTTMDVAETHPIVTQMQAGSCADYLMVSGENRGDEEREKAVLIDIEQIRAIDHFLSLTRANCPMRVVIIDGAEAMNANAANALLKNLEEPPAHTVMVLICHNQAKLLPTIRSRCQVIAFKPLDLSECQQILAGIAPQATIPELQLLAALSDASPGLALKWLKLGAAGLYERLCAIFAMPQGDDAAQIAAVIQFAEDITSDRSTIHQRFQMVSGLLLAFFNRLHQREPMAAPEWELSAMQRWKTTQPPSEWAAAWFIIKEQCNMAEHLHLDYRHLLTTLLLRLVRGKMPLSMKAG